MIYFACQSKDEKACLRKEDTHPIRKEKEKNYTHKLKALKLYFTCNFHLRVSRQNIDFKTNKKCINICHWVNKAGFMFLFKQRKKSRKKRKILSLIR